MKCPECGKKLYYCEDVTATSNYEIIKENEDEIIVTFIEDDNFDTKNSYLKCNSCGKKIKPSKPISFH